MAATSSLQGGDKREEYRRRRPGGLGRTSTEIYKAELADLVHGHQNEEADHGEQGKAGKGEGKAAVHGVGSLQVRCDVKVTLVRLL